MITSTVRLLAERGLTGTSVRDVVADSGAPRGSVYHHFPGGKPQLVGEAVESAGGFIGESIRQATVEAGPLAALDAFVAGWRQSLERSEFRAGCPIVAVAVEAEADDDGAPVEAAGRAFAQWSGLFAASLRRAGVPRDRAARLGTLVVSAIEGAIVLARAQRDTAPLDDVGRELRTIVGAVLDDAGG